MQPIEIKILLLWIIKISIIYAQTNQAAIRWLTLEDVINYGVQYSQQAEESKAKLDREQKELEVVEKRIYPQIVFSNSMSYAETKTLDVVNIRTDILNLGATASMTLPYIGSSLSTSFNYIYQNDGDRIDRTYRVSYTQPLLKGLKKNFLRTDLRKAELDADRYKLERKYLLHEIALELFIDWWRLVLYREEVILAKKVVDKESQFMEASKVLWNVGRLKKTEYENSVIQLENANIDLKLKEAALINAELDLIEKIGIAIGPKENIKLRLEQKNIFERQIDVESFNRQELLANNYQYQIINTQINKSEYEIIEAEDGLLYDISLQVSYGQSFYKELHYVDDSFRASLDFSIPLFQYNEELALEIAKEQEKTLLIQKEFLIKKLKNQFQKNKRDLNLVLQEIDFARKKIKYYKTLVDDELEKFKRGRTEMIEVRKLENEYFSHEKSLVEIVVKKINLEIDLYRMMGQLPIERSIIYGR